MKIFKKFLIEYVFNFKKFVSVSIAAVICLILFVVMLGSTSFLYSSYTKSKETEKKIADMNSFLEDWQRKVDKLEGSEFRPVSAKDLDDIQATLLFNLQLNNLKLDSFRSLSPQKTGPVKDNSAVPPANGKEKDGKKQKQNKKELQNSRHDYEIEFEGDYSSVMKYINNFKAKNALINIQGVELKSKKGVIKAQVKYRAYTL